MDAGQVAGGPVQARTAAESRVGFARLVVPDGARLVLATHSKGKLFELNEILEQSVRAHGGELPPGAVVTAGQLGAPEPVEDGVTFEENALTKARALVAATGLPAIGDDSGLAVDVLGGAPGIFSARWAGRHGDDQANLDLLLGQLAEIPAQHRAAAFVCAAALVTPEGTEVVRVGRLRGTLLTAPRGSGGFGYDPILLPDGETRACAELTPQEKNAISHRGQAFRALAPEIVRILGQSAGQS